MLICVGGEVPARRRTSTLLLRWRRRSRVPLTRLRRGMFFVNSHAAKMS